MEEFQLLSLVVQVELVVVEEVEGQKTFLHLMSAQWWSLLYACLFVLYNDDIFSVL